MGCDITFATSGAIVMSDVGQIARMLWPGIDAIEIGSLRSAEDLELVLETVRRRGLRWGVHAPLWRSGLRREEFDARGLSPASRTQLDGDFREAARCAAQYILVHFPWFSDASLPVEQAAAQVQAAMRDLWQLRERHGIPVVFEFKLGRARDPGILAYLMRDGTEMLGQDDFGWCLDVGDWLMASQALRVDPVEAFGALAPRTEVIHVHAVERATNPYLWKPIHPEDPDATAVLALCDLAVAKSPRLRIVFEHTSHLDPGPEYDLAGYRWLRQALTGEEPV